MKIEILTALKRAGFPLPDVDKIAARFNTTVAVSKVPEVFPNAQKVEGHWYLEPTIEQLFSALNSSFQLLEKTDAWGAIGRAAAGQKLAVGETAQEALAKLWLELHK